MALSFIGGLITGWRGFILGSIVILDPLLILASTDWAIAAWNSSSKRFGNASPPLCTAFVQCSNYVHLCFRHQRVALVLEASNNLVLVEKVEPGR